jgi:hypothetical protein
LWQFARFALTFCDSAEHTITEKIRLKQSKETKATGTFTHDELYLYWESGGVAAHATEP